MNARVYFLKKAFKDSVRHLSIIYREASEDQRSKEWVRIFRTRAACKAWEAGEYL